MALALTHPAFHQVFEAQAARDPGAIALALDAETWSYGTLNERANRLARALGARGVGPGSLVALHLRGLFAMPLAILAVHKAGAAYVAVEPALPEARRATMLEVAGRPVLLTDEALAPALAAGASAVWTWEALQAEADGQPGDDLGLPVPDGAVACLFFTSGSTGVPKAVVMPHRSIAGHIGTVPAIARIDASDRYLFTASYSFVLSIRLMLQLAVGGRVVLVPPEEKGDPLALLARVKATGVTCMSLVPTFWRACVQALEALSPEARGRLLDNRLRLIQVVGEPLRPDLPLRWSRDWGHPARVVNFYGQTEIFSVACFEVPVGWDDGPGVPIGRPAPTVEVHLLDAAMRPVPDGTPGEIYAAGGWTAAGYLNDAAATGEKFLPNPFGEGRLCRTGDVARREEDGTLVLMGRGDRMLKIRGQRVEPGDVEACLLKHPAVASAAVVGQSDGADGVRLVAFLTAKPGDRPDASAMRRFVAQALPAAMVPSAIAWLSELPVNANGKVDMASLRVRPCDVPAEAVGAHAPLTAIEARVAAVWGRILGHPVSDPTADFFDLGGDSLQAARLLTALEREFARRLDLGPFIASPTIAAIAETLAQAPLDGDQGLLWRVRSGGDRAPLILLPPIRGDRATYLRLFMHLETDRPVFGADLVGAVGGRFDAPLETLAACYVREIQARFPRGGCLLGGHSSGGVLAYEVARQLELAGTTVGRVLLFDSVISDRQRNGRGLRGLVVRSARLAEFVSGVGLLAVSARAWGAIRALQGPTRPPADATARPAVPSAAVAAQTPTAGQASSARLGPLALSEMVDLVYLARLTLAPVRRLHAVALAARLLVLPALQRRRPWVTLLGQAEVGESAERSPSPDMPGGVRLATVLLVQALRAYTMPGPLSAPITLFLATEPPTPEGIAWQAYGAVTRVPVPGSHDSIMAMPHVAVLASRLAEAIAPGD